MTQAEQIKELQGKFKELEKRIEEVERRLGNLEPNPFPEDDPHENDL